MKLCLLLMTVMLGMCLGLAIGGHACLAFTFGWAGISFACFAVMLADG